MAQHPRRQRPQVRVLIISPDVMTGELLTGTSNHGSNNFKVSVLIGDSNRILDQLGAYKPHVALISEELQDGPQEGFKVLQELQHSHHNTAAIMLLKCSNPDSVINAFRAGARGIFYRTHSLKTLPKCIRTVYQGQIWASNEDLEHVLSGLRHLEPLSIHRHKWMVVVDASRGICRPAGG